MKQPCIDCGTPTNGTRCPQHQTGHTRQRNRTAQTRRANLGGRPYDQGTYRTQAAHIRATATTCHICGQGPRPDDPWQADHLIPITKGGQVGPLAPAHRSCNIGRANKLRAGKPDPANPPTNTRTPHRPPTPQPTPTNHPPTNPNHNNTTQQHNNNPQTTHRQNTNTPRGHPHTP